MGGNSSKPTGGASGANPEEPWVFAVGLDKGDHARPLGIRVDDSSDPQALTVLQITAGLVQDHNAHNPEYTILPGDRIVDVNGVRGSADLMKKEMMGKDHLTVTLERKAQTSPQAPPLRPQSGRMGTSQQPYQGPDGTRPGSSNYREPGGAPPGSRPGSQPGSRPRVDQPHGHQPRPSTQSHREQQPHHHHHHHHHHREDEDLYHTPLPNLGPPADPGYALDAYVEGRWLAEAPRSEALVNRERRRDWGYDPFYMWRNDPLIADELNDPFGEWRAPRGATSQPWNPQLQDDEYYYSNAGQQQGGQNGRGGQQRGGGSRAPPPPPPPQGSAAGRGPPSQPLQEQQRQILMPEKLLAGPPLRGAGPEAALFLPMDTMEAAATRRTKSPGRTSALSQPGVPVPELVYGGRLQPTISVLTGRPPAVMWSPANVGTSDTLAPVRVVGAH